MQFYTKKQERQLLKIPKGTSGSPERVKQLALIWGKGQAGIIAKWYALHAEKEKLSGPVSVAGKSTGTGVIPMHFTGIDFTGGKSRVNEREEKSMKQGLELAIRSELSNPKRGILFPRRLVNRAKKFFAEKYPANVFSFHSNGKKDKNNVVLVKRM